MFEEVKDEGQRCISTRRVCTLKQTLSGLKIKARLVARGFEEFKVSELQKGLTHMCHGVCPSSHSSDLSKTVDTPFYGYKISISTGNAALT